MAIYIYIFIFLSQYQIKQIIYIFTLLYIFVINDLNI